MGDPGSPFMELLRSQEPDISRIVPTFVARFNAAYGDPGAERWDISMDDWQRYEFLGDRVLSLVIAQTLFVQRDAVLDEGEMTEMLAGMVSNKSLNSRFGQVGALALLLPAAMGDPGCPGERAMAGAFEAFIGSLYCEVGLDDVAFFVNALFAPALLNENLRHNVIGALQEHYQKRGEPLPVYRETGRTGPDHGPRFTVAVTLPDGRTYSGEGPTLSDARKSAARAALDELGLNR